MVSRTRAAWTAGGVAHGGDGDVEGGCGRPQGQVADSGRVAGDHLGDQGDAQAVGDQLEQGGNVVDLQGGVAVQAGLGELAVEEHAQTPQSGWKSTNRSHP
jgi:hypothetical protein